MNNKWADQPEQMHSFCNSHTQKAGFLLTQLINVGTKFVQLSLRVRFEC